MSCGREHQEFSEKKVGVVAEQRTEKGFKGKNVRKSVVGVVVRSGEGRNGGFFTLAAFLLDGLH